MDGNGRWAKKHNRERFYGHQAGAEAAKDIVETAAEIGIRFLTLYAFSKENWNRPQEEVKSLMQLLIQGVTDNLEYFKSLNIKLKTIGDFENLPENVKQSVLTAQNQTKENTGLTLIVALNYGSRWEILEAVKKIALNIEKKIISIDDINEDLFDKNLNTAGIPDPDLLIRTSGEVRISNFLLWQISYSELYFSDLCWPDFRKAQLIEAILHFQNRERRFGKTSTQIKNNNENCK